MKKRLGSIVLALALCIGMMPTMAWADVDGMVSTSDDIENGNGTGSGGVVTPAGVTVTYDGDAQDDQGIAVQADGVNYIDGIIRYDKNGDPVWSEVSIPDNCATLDSNSHELTEECYVVSPNASVTINGDVTLGGANDIHKIILGNNASLTISGSVTIPGGHKLCIYGQKNNDGQMTVDNPNGCAFKSDSSSVSAYVCMYGGVLKATGTEHALDDGVYLLSGGGSDYQMSIKCTDNVTGKVVKATVSDSWCSNTPSGDPSDQTFSAKSFTLERCDDQGEEVEVWVYEPVTGNTHSETCSLCGYRRGGSGYTVDCDFEYPYAYKDVGADEHQAICMCGNVNFILESHTFVPVVTDDGKGHTLRCGKCHYTQAGGSVTPHRYNEDGECDDCSFIPVASDNNGNLYDYIDDALQAAADGTADWVQLDSQAAGDKFVRESISFGAAGKPVTLKMNGQRLESGDVALTVNSGTLTIPDAAVIQSIGTNESAGVGVQLSGGTLVFENDLAAQGGYNSDGRKPAVNAAGGTLDLRGDLELNGGLTLTGSAQLQNKLTQGTFYIGNSTNGKQLDGKTVSVEGSTKYTNVCDLLADGYAFAKCDASGKLVDAAGNTTENPVLVAGNVKSITENVKIVAHEHSWNNSQCACGVVCEHRGDSTGTRWKDGKCTVCGYACEHKNGVNEYHRCKTCLYQMAVRIDNPSSATYIPRRINNGFDESLSDALGKAQNGDTLTLLVDHMLARSYSNPIEDKSVTIDFNGKWLTENGGIAVRGSDAQSPGTLTITGTGGSTAIEGGFGTNAIHIGQNGKLVTKNWSGTLNKLRIDAKDAQAELDGGTFNSIEASFTNLDATNIDKADFTMGSLLKAGYAFQYTSDSEHAGEYVAYTKRLAYQVADVDATISHVQVVECPHTKIEDTGHCAYCDTTGFVAAVTKNGVTNAYTDLATALNEADGGTVKLLADAGTMTVSSALTLDLNGKNVTSLTVSAKATIVDSATTKGTITTLTTGNGVTLGDLCEQGFGFKSTTGNVWSDEFATSVGNVRIAEAPIKSVAINGKTAGNVAVKSYGTSDLELRGEINYGSASGTATQKWYQVKGGKVTEVQDAGGLVYGPPTFLDAGTYIYRLTVTIDGYSKSSDTTVIVNPANIKRAQIVVSNKDDLVFTPGADGNGTSLTAKITVNRGTKGLTEGKDYTVAGNQQTNAGSYELTITGTGNYTGTKTVGWEIKKNTVKVPDIADIIKTYDGTTDLPAGFALGTFKSDDSDQTGVADVSLTAGTDYTMTGHYTDADAGSGKTVRLQLEMRNPNYLFDNGQTTRTLLVDKTFYPNTQVVIKQAVMPAFTNMMSLNVVNNQALTYTTELPALPKLTGTCNYGDVTYEITGNTLDSSYYTDGASVDANGVLTLPIRSVATDTEGSIGTITVTVKTTNYTDAVLTVNISAVNKIAPQKQSIEVSAITYGEPLGKADFTAFTFVEPGTSNQIAGTLAWQNPDKLLEAGTHEEGWVFTPADGDKYAGVTGTVEVTVVPAKVTGAPKYTAITQSGRTVSDAALTVEGGTFSTTGTVKWVDNDGNGLPADTEVKQGTAYKWLFTPADTKNYRTLSGEIVLWAAVSTGGGSSSGGGASAPAEGGEVVTVENKAGASTQIITKVTVKDAKTETTRNAQGQDVSKTTAAVSEKLAEQLVNQAVKNNSDIIEIMVSSDGKNSDAGAADSVRSTELTLPKSAVTSIAKNTDADLVIKTDNGDLVLDNKTLQTIASKEGGDAVQIIVSENTPLADAQKPATDVIGSNGRLFDLAAKIGDTFLHGFEGGKAHITLPVPKALNGKEISVIYINDEGLCEIINHSMDTIGGDSYVKFTTSHFSTFAIVEKAAAGAKLREQNQAQMKARLGQAGFKAVTTKTEKKNVRIRLTVKNDKKLIAGLKAMGYTVKYRFYRSEKKSAGYVELTTKRSSSFVNTKGTKGKKYYYKVKVLVYDDKKLVAQTKLGQCSAGAKKWNK